MQRVELDGVTHAVELIRRLRRLYAEDDAQAHIAAVQELVAAATASPRLAAQIRVETARWQDFAAQVITGFVTDTPLAALIPVRESARNMVPNTHDRSISGREVSNHLPVRRLALANPAPPPQRVRSRLVDDRVRERCRDVNRRPVFDGRGWLP